MLVDIWKSYRNLPACSIDVIKWCWALPASKNVKFKIVKKWTGWISVWWYRTWRWREVGDSSQSTRMNTLILPPVTGHCTGQPGAAETAPGSQFQLGCAWLTGHNPSPTLCYSDTMRCKHSQLQVFVICSAPHMKTNRCLIFSLVQKVLGREGTLSTLIVHAKVNI